MKLKTTYLAAIIILITLSSFTNKPATKMSNTLSTLDSASFDFWLGKWDATWDENGTTCHGTNTITRAMNDFFIHENFVVLDGANKGFVGESYSILDKKDGNWKQTWIDNTGGYLEFTGAIDGESKIFEQSFVNKKGKKIYQRMRFYNIQKDSFLWDWENSTDGKTWTLSWRINYTRAK